MTLEKAIEILADYKMQSAFEATPAFEEATGLGIEALRRCQVLAENNPLWAAKPLPGETKE